MASIARIVFTILLLSCVSSQPEKPQSVTLVPPPPVSAEPPKMAEEEPSAGDLLETAFLQYHTSLWRSAINSFDRAIATGNLNDAGRALAYWHIGDCALRINEEDMAAEAFFAFTVAGQAVLDVRDQRRFAVDQDGDFVEHFGLEKRMQDAVNFLNDLWKERQKE